MEEYQRLYKLYITKTDSELQEILNAKDDYTEIAIKVASDILNSRRISHEEITEKPRNSDISLSSNYEKEKRGKNIPVWLLIIALISGLAAGGVLTSAFFDLRHAANIEKNPTNIIEGYFYDGTNDYFGLVFYFYDDNTYRCFTSSGNNILYGTYDIKGNALTLKISNDTYSAVIVDDGNKIMINDSELQKVTDSNQASKYRSALEDSDANDH